MTIDAYRIAKRVSPGQPITFEFRADQPGTFPLLLQPSDRRRLPPDARRAGRQTASVARSGFKSFERILTTKATKLPL